jgi:hypothetical protein
MDLLADWGNSSVGSGNNEVLNPSENNTQDPNPASSASSSSATQNVQTQQTSTTTVPKGSESQTPAQETPKTGKATDLIQKNSQNGGGQTGDGSDNQTGNVGNPNGLIEGKGVFGGKGGGGGWSIQGGGTMTRNPDAVVPDEEGKVHVDILVDKQGNVVSAIANPSKSTTTSSKLYQLAEKSAKTAKFSVRDDGNSGKRKGSIVFTFKLG